MGDLLENSGMVMATTKKGTDVGQLLHYKIAHRKNCACENTVLKDRTSDFFGGLVA